MKDAESKIERKASSGVARETMKPAETTPTNSPERLMEIAKDLDPGKELRVVVEGSVKSGRGWRAARFVDVYEVVGGNGDKGLRFVKRTRLS